MREAVAHADELKQRQQVVAHRCREGAAGTSRAKVSWCHPPRESRHKIRGTGGGVLAEALNAVRYSVHALAGPCSVHVEAQQRAAQRCHPPTWQCLLTKASFTTSSALTTTHGPAGFDKRTSQPADRRWLCRRCLLMAAVTPLL